MLFHTLKPSRDTLLCYFEMFHLAPSPSSLQIVEHCTGWLGNRTLQYIYTYTHKNVKVIELGMRGDIKV